MQLYYFKFIGVCFELRAIRSVKRYNGEGNESDEINRVIKQKGNKLQKYLFQ